MLNDTELKRLQRCELMIAEEIKRVCTSEGIPFFMVFGTMLGAIRHGGFIPWDDDIDFGVPAEYYDKFRQACLSKLSENFELQDWDVDPDYPYPFGKIRLKNTVADENFTSEKSSHRGIFVDVFPIIEINSDAEFKLRAEKKNTMYMRKLWIKKGYGKCIRRESFKQRVKYDVFKFINLFSNYEKTKESYKKFISGLADNASGEMLTLGSNYSIKKLIIMRDWTENLVDYTFENITLPGFKEYDSYLSLVYGDYMKLPDEKDRHTHEIKSVDFGRYKNISIS